MTVNKATFSQEISSRRALANNKNISAASDKLALLGSSQHTIGLNSTINNDSTIPQKKHNKEQKVELDRKAKKLSEYNTLVEKIRKELDIE